MSFVCVARRTVFDCLRPQIKLLTCARFDNFTPLSTAVGKNSRKNSIKISSIPEDKSVNRYDKAFSMAICKRYHSSHSANYRKYYIGSYRNLESFLHMGVIQHNTSHIQNWSKHHDRRYSTNKQDSDINRQSSIIAMFPKIMQPYLVLGRLDRPIGYWLLYLPATWSISLAAEAGSLPNLNLLILFFAGSVLMRTAGCIINDMWDTDLDKKDHIDIIQAKVNKQLAILRRAKHFLTEKARKLVVARTSSRPLAAGEITSFQALVFLGSQLSIAFGILLSLNLYSIVLGASSLVLVVTYPLMKRITFWPQLFLGITFNWGCLLGWTAVTGSLEWSVCLPLYAAGISWTIFYDTIYAFQDVEDDERVGIKSTALLFGDQTKTYLTAFSAIMMTNLLAVGLNTSQTWPFYLCLTGVASHLTWQLTQVDLSQPKDCLSKFKSNRWLGIFLWISIVMSTLLKPKDKNVEEIND